MTTDDALGNGPALLQLQRWSQLRFQLDLSEFSEASISPTRKLLLLLSYRREALLLPLIWGGVPLSLPSKNDSSRLLSENLQIPSSLYPEMNTNCWSKLLSEAPSSESPENGTSLAPTCYPMISDVKSFTWGHWGDTYSQFKDSSFRELLIVCSDGDITVHAFRSIDSDNPLVKSEPDDASANGKWVEWGPTHPTEEKERLPPSQIFENTVDIKKSNTYVENQCDSGESKDVNSSNMSSMQQHWFQTFQTEVDSVISDDKFLARFPTESSFPRSAEVVSFSIYNSTLRFLEFFACISSKSCKVDEVAAVGTMSKTPVINFSHEVPSSLRRTAVCTGIPFNCSRVFSSSFHHLVGMVLDFSKNAKLNNTEDHQKSSSKVLVVVSLYQWGMKWVCSVDLQNQFPGPGPNHDWTDFQFSGNFLLCLSSSGLICIWGAETGVFVTQFDVRTCCGPGSKIYSTNQPNLSVSRDIDTRVPSFDGKFVKRSEANETETYSRELVCSRTFRRLMVASHSLLLAVVDDNGVVYMICLGDIISEKQHIPNNFMPSSDLGLLEGWKVAGCEIVGQQVFAGLSKAQGLHTSDISSEVSSNTYLNRDDGFGGSWQVKCKEKNLGSLSSGFAKSSERNVWKMSYSPLRRIFLPPGKFEKEDFICFSPFGITRLVKTCNSKEQKTHKVVHTGLHVAPSVMDESDIDATWPSKWCSTQMSAFVDESIGCSFQGCLYLVTRSGLSVILPSVSVSSSTSPIECIKYWQPTGAISTKYQINNLLELGKSRELWMPWQMEVLDRVLLYEGPDEAEYICLKNGWDTKFARVRRLQLALQYLKLNEIEQSLDRLVNVNMAEEGIIRLLFTSVYQISSEVGGDNDVALASRLLALATCFATKMVRRYGLLEHKRNECLPYAKKDLSIPSLPQLLPKHLRCQVSNSRRLYEMAHLLEVIRKIQSRLSARNRRVGQEELEDGRDATSMVGREVLQGDSPLPMVAINKFPSEIPDAREHQACRDLALTAPDVAYDTMDNLALTTTEPSDVIANLSEFRVAEGGSAPIRLFSVENPGEMIARWEIENFNLKSVVKDALQSGRLPLAVLQLHLQRKKELVSEQEYYDLFSEVREIGRSIAYELFLKGENGLAMATLQRLGEDVEIILRQLLLGTVRRSLREQIAVEMQRHSWLRLHELTILERLSLIERLYPSSSFWGTFLAKQKNTDANASLFDLSEANNLKVIFHVCENLAIECGDIDGVVNGVWGEVDHGSTFSMGGEDNTYAGYWACAAIWSDVWDQRTMDRIVLDQPFYMGVHVSWDSQLEYHLSHNNLEEVYRLLDVIPTSLLSEGSLKVNLDSLHSFGNAGNHIKNRDYSVYISSAEELEPVCMEIPNVKIFRFSSINTCSSWLRMLMEQELAKKYIFVDEYWGSTAKIMPLLARAGLIIDPSNISIRDKTSVISLDLDIFRIGEQPNKGAPEALRKLVVQHSAQYNLPNLLDLYFDHHNLVFDDNSHFPLLEAAGDCQWAKWMLFSRKRGHEYDASFSNARSTLSHQISSGNNLSVIEIDEIIRTVDDIAEGGGEMAALATLMHASLPVQHCICTGSVNRNYSSSCQCTLENLRPGLQQFPTLWRILVAACFGQEYDCSSGSNSTNVRGKSSFLDYVNWRYSIFSSAGGDCSLIQMLPCWFPKPVRRLVKLFVQGPLGWQPLLAEEPFGAAFLYKDGKYAFTANRNVGVSAISWEATIQKSVEEFYSSLKENGFGMEHHLHRGRSLAAFNHLLGVRVLKLKSANSRQVVTGQSSIQADVQTILASLTQSEGSLISSVMPLAIMHFEDSILVSSCAFLLELCGLSASLLRVDISALRRISSYHNSIEQNARYENISPKGSTFHSGPQEGDLAVSLARALADDYMHHDYLNIINQKDVPDKISTGKQSPRTLITVLHHLEKASLPLMDEGSTCGSWLSSGNGDGFELRNKQKDASQYWNLVTTFCQMHHLPLSTKYLAFLANDNDWVGFLAEAQMVGFAIDEVIQVATQEFSDPRLKTHIITVLNSMQLIRKKTSSSDIPSAGINSEVPVVADSNTVSSTELFGILAECERQKNPGESLLIKAKDLRWSLLAMVASCFPDVSSLSCLTVWLEITAARETSSIKVNDISSKIAECVGAAVDATNKLPSGSRTLTLRYNRKNPKRRCIIEPSLERSAKDASTSLLNSSSSIVSIAQEIANEEERRKIVIEQSKVSSDSDETLASLANMVAVLCEQHLFLPLLRAFEMFMPSCSLLPFIRSLQAFSQMRLSDASAHLASFSARLREEPFLIQTNIARDWQIKTSWISSTAAKAADAMLSTCPSAYEKRCLLQLLSAADFGDGGSASTYFRRLYWKINLAEPSLRKDDDLNLGSETLDDASLLTALERNGHWEQARNWAKQLESSGASWKSAVHHVTETQAEAMVAEWKEFLWDIPEERAALWSHCQTLFMRYSFPSLQAGLFFLKHAEDIEKEIPPKELHEMLLLSLQWLSGMIAQSHPVYPLHLLREIETRVWLLAVESEAQSKSESDFTMPSSIQCIVGVNGNSVIEQTASVVTKMDNHINSMRMRITDRNNIKENNLPQYRHSQLSDASTSVTSSSTRTKRRNKNYLLLRRPVVDNTDTNNDSDDYPVSPRNRSNVELSKNVQLQEENVKIEASVSGWEERVSPADMERAVLSLLEFGQITAAKQLQHKLSPAHVPSELQIVDAALKIADLSSSSGSAEVGKSMLNPDVLLVVQTLNIPDSNHMINALQVLESLASKCGEGCGRGLCGRIVAVVRTAKVLDIPFTEAFEKRPLELLQLLSLKAQDSLEEAKLLVQTHAMPASSIAQILAESFLKGLLAAHRGGYMDSQKEEGPAPLLWRFSDFLKWAELCPSEPEIGHALMRLVMTGQDIPHACEVELLILSHHFYKSSACLDGVDVLVTLAANRIESYVSEGDFSCLARLITGVSNFHALNFILNILIEKGQLELLLQKYSAAETGATSTAETVRGFRMAVLTSLKLFNPHDLDAFAVVYNHFDMKHETAALLESRSMMYMQQWFSRRDKDRQNEDLLESMRHLIESAEVLSTIDAGHKTHRACARASLLSLQIRIPDLNWLELSETNARRVFVEQTRFQEALIVAEAYKLNQPSEWAPVLWNLMLKPDLIEQFVAEFVVVLPLQSSMLLELAKFYRAEVAARGDQSHFSVWLSPGGLPAEWVKHLGRSFRSLLRRTRDLRVRLQLATTATGFGDVTDMCMRVLDKVPETAGPLVLRRGHGGAYIPLM